MTKKTLFNRTAITTVSSWLLTATLISLSAAFKMYILIPFIILFLFFSLFMTLNICNFKLFCKEYGEFFGMED